MSDSGRGGDKSNDLQGTMAAYEAPRISWREPYQPMSFGVSCAKQPGNPGCAPGPLRK